MKFMGSKRAMLTNGLGKILLSESKLSKRFADLFTGSAAVSWFVAERTPLAVLASDLQLFSSALALGILNRDRPLESEILWNEWIARANIWASDSGLESETTKFEARSWGRARKATVEAARTLCALPLVGSGDHSSPITFAYGGHYFSPKQALWLDALRASLPTEPQERAVALAALIIVASECAASPGHTAQPFQPTVRAAKFIWEAWRKDVVVRTQRVLGQLAPRHAVTIGAARVADALEVASSLREGDLAFIDPPYSAVHYSRFYHVLETIANGSLRSVSGAGRYPPTTERAQSDFSVPSRAEAAFQALFKNLAASGAKSIVTFPKENTSNGLSGRRVEELAEGYFNVRKTEVNGRFSTLGGTGTTRHARIPAYEIILVLTPK